MQCTDAEQVYEYIPINVQLKRHISFRESFQLSPRNTAVVSSREL